MRVLARMLVGVAPSRWIVAGAVCWLGVGVHLVALAAPAITGEPPAATISKPPEVSGVPFGATSIDLPAKGYAEEEFFVSGVASRYRMKDPLGTAQIVEGGHPFTTRILVRRPTDPSKFNGRVLLEWFNVSTHEDLDVVFAAMRTHLLDSGYVWVGISAQVQGMEALRSTNPKRYGQLNLTASNDDPLGGQLDPTSDVLGWDAYTQAANALRNPSGGLDPLHGLKPKLIFAAGESQSAMRLTGYYNSILPLYKHTFDGFLLYDRVLGGMRTDLGTKMLAFGSEALRSGSAAPPDNANLRVWEVAGASHISYDEVIPYLEEQYARMGVVRAFDGTPYNISQTFVGCQVSPLFSRVPNGDVLNAGIEALAQWVTRGTPPATAERLRADANGKLYREGEGRVSGGIRLAAYDAPISRNRGTNTPGLACSLAGSHQDYAPAELRQLYGTPAEYVARVVAITRKAKEDGFLLESDAEKTIAEAKRVQF